MSLPNAITREDFYLNKIANPSDDHELPDAITRQQHYLKAIAENAGGGGGGGGAVNYSTEEREVGTWIDGSPLYQKTVYYAGGVNENITFNHNITGIDRVVSVEAIASDSSTAGSYLPLTRMDNDDNIVAISFIDRTTIGYAVSAVFDSRVVDLYFTVRYTKTQ